MEMASDFKQKVYPAIMVTLWGSTILASVVAVVCLLFIEGWASEEGAFTFLFIVCSLVAAILVSFPVGDIIAKHSRIISTEDSRVFVCAVAFLGFFIVCQFMRPAHEVAPGHARITDTGEVFTEGQIVPRTMFRFSSAEVKLTSYPGPGRAGILGYTTSDPVESTVLVSVSVVWEPRSAKFQQVAARHASDLYNIDELFDTLRAEVLSPLILDSVDTLLTEGLVDGTSLKFRLGAALDKTHGTEPSVQSIDIRKVFVSHVTVRNP